MTDQEALDGMPPAIPRVKFTGSATVSDTHELAGITAADHNRKVRVSLDCVVSAAGWESYKTDGVRDVITLAVTAINTAKIN